MEEKIYYTICGILFLIYGFIMVKYYRKEPNFMIKFSISTMMVGAIIAPIALLISKLYTYLNLLL